jgi:hypothetical protein
MPAGAPEAGVPTDGNYLDGTATTVPSTILVFDACEAAPSVILNTPDQFFGVLLKSTTRLGKVVSRRWWKFEGGVISG